MAEWRQQFDDLRQRRPDLADRVCRRLLMDLQRKGLVDLDALDELAEALKLGGARPRYDPNRPIHGAREDLGDDSPGRKKDAGA